MPPRLLTKASTREPDSSPRSSRIGVAICAATSAALPSCARRRPGSPWMPTPSSISPGLIWKIGEPADGGVHELSATPKERARSLTRWATAATSCSDAPCSALAPAIFSSSTVAPVPRRPGRVQAVLHRHVVVDQDGLHADAVVVQHVGRHLEVQHVAGVVLDDVQHAGAAVGGLAAGQHLVGHGRREDGARACGVEHPEPDEPAVQRLVTAAAAGHQRDLALDRPAGPQHDLVLQVDRHQVGVSGREPGQGLRDDVVRVVQELAHHMFGGAHLRLPSRSVMTRMVADHACTSTSSGRVTASAIGSTTLRGVASRS